MKSSFPSSIIWQMHSLCEVDSNLSAKHLMEYISRQEIQFRVFRLKSIGVPWTMYFLPSTESTDLFKVLIYSKLNLKNATRWQKLPENPRDDPYGHRALSPVSSSPVRWQALFFACVPLLESNWEDDLSRWSPRPSWSWSRCTTLSCILRIWTWYPVPSQCAHGVVQGAPCSPQPYTSPVQGFKRSCRKNIMVLRHIACSSWQNTNTEHDTTMLVMTYHDLQCCK